MIESHTHRLPAKLLRLPPAPLTPILKCTLKMSSACDAYKVIRALELFARPLGMTLQGVADTRQ